MGSYESMKTKLEAVGIYSITENSNISDELKAYAEGIDEVFDTLDEMTRECFTETAESYGITNRERFFGKERTEYTLEKRREILRLAEQTTQGRCNVKAFEDTLKGYGLSDFTITELFSMNKVAININDALTEPIKKMVEERIVLDFPAHLNVVAIFADTTQ